MKNWGTMAGLLVDLLLPSVLPPLIAVLLIIITVRFIALHQMIGGEGTKPCVIGSQIPSPLIRCQGEHAYLQLKHGIMSERCRFPVEDTSIVRHKCPSSHDPLLCTLLMVLSTTLDESNRATSSCFLIM